MSSTPIVPNSIDDLFQTTAVGSLDKAIGNNLYGINHRQTPGAVPSNKELYGLTFFVRPQLNLLNDNLRMDRLFYPLLSNDVNSLFRYIRTTLDPRLMAGYTFRTRVIAPIGCPFVDNNNPFIAVLSNNLTSLSGWPDLVLPVHTSNPGLYNETQTIADGITRDFKTFTLTANFRNTKGDPILFLFYIWLHYISAVIEGRMLPYMDMITENRFDYNTRIYRLVLDSTRTYVRKIASTIAVPVSDMIGGYFDFNIERPYNDQNKDISVQFQCDGVEYFDPILVYEFNKTVQIFNPLMEDMNRERFMHKLDPTELKYFNNRGYPRIDTTNNMLEWWVPNDLYNVRVNSLRTSELLTDITSGQFLSRG